MSNDFKFSKTIIVIIGFLFLFGLVVLGARSDFFYQHDISNGKEIQQSEKQTSALTEEEQKEFQQDRYLVIFNPDRPESIAMKDNTVKVLEYMKKEFEAVTLSEVPQSLSDYQNVIIAFSSLEMAADFPRILNYAAEGGKLFFASRPELDSVYFDNYRRLGIEQANNNFRNTTGIKMSSNLLLQGEGMKINDDIIANSSLSIQLNQSSEVLAWSYDGLPLLWKTPYKKGEIMVFNGTMFDSKAHRGLIAGSLSYLNEDFIYPILNSKVVYIDDFPAPFPEGNHKAIYDTYKMDTPTFFREVWWPDMLASAEKYNFKYTGVLIETYEDDVNGPFNNRLVKENLKIYGRELIKMGGEVGVHGYNHQSLTENQEQVKGLGYTAWEDRQAMIKSLNEVEQFFNELFPDYELRTYVPPSNVLSEEGRQALSEAIPSVDNIGSLYHPDTEIDSYIQEYEANEDFNELPRLTSDYLYRDDTRWNMANGATLHGAFSHFIHPDDVLDVDRSESKTWPQMLEDFNHILADVQEKYPWMRSHTASESGESLRSYQDAEVFLSQEKDKIEIFVNHFSGELDFILRSEKAVKNTKGCEVEKISKDHYLVHVTSNEAEVELEEQS